MLRYNRKPRWATRSQSIELLATGQVSHRCEAYAMGGNLPDPEKPKRTALWYVPALAVLSLVYCIAALVPGRFAVTDEVFFKAAGRNLGHDWTLCRPGDHGAAVPRAPAIGNLFRSAANIHISFRGFGEGGRLQPALLHRLRHDHPSAVDLVRDAIRTNRLRPGLELGGSRQRSSRALGNRWTAR